MRNVPRRPLIMFVFAWLSFAIALLGSRYVLSTHGLQNAAHLAVVALPIVPILWCAWSFVYAYASVDERERRIQAEGSMFGFVVTATCLVAYMVLEGAAVVPAPPSYAVFTVLMFAYSIGIGVNRFRYR